jgi:hypothetical protein
MTAPHQNLLGISGAVAEEETDPNFNQTVLLLDGDGTNGGQNNTFLDSSTNNFSITRNGTPTQGTFNPFLGEGQYSRYSKTGSTRDSHGSGVTLGTNNFTIGMFVYPIGRSDAIGSTLNSGGNSRTTLYADTGADTFIIAHDQLLVNAGSLWTITINYTTDIVLNQWQWIQVDRTGSTFRVSIDGSYVDGGGATSSGTIPAITTGTFGERSGQADYIGYFSNFILINNANRGSIATPTAPLTADSDTALLLHQSNRYVNNGNTSVTLTFGGDNIISTNSPFTQSKTANVGSGFFDGSGDKIQNNDNILDLDTGSWTVEAWFYQVGNGENGDGTGNTIIIIGDSSSINSVWLTSTNAGAIAGRVRFNGSSWETTLSGGTVSINQWTHVALVKDSSNSDRVDLYVNGVSQANSTNSTDLTTYGREFAIGGQIGANRNLNGYIADARVVIGSAVYTSTFTPPTSSLTAVTNTNLLTCQYSGAVRNVGFLDDSKYNTRFVRAGDVSMGTFSPFSLEDTYWSWYFNGNNPVEIADANNGLDLSGDFTVEFWAYEPKIATTGGTVNMYFTIDTLDRFQFSNNGSNAIFYINGGSVFSSTTPPLNQWNHIAIVRSGSDSNNISYYLNGTRQTQGTSTYSIAAASMMLGGQDRGGTTGYHGSFMYMSNFRILKGTALYSGASITVPTEPLTAITNTSLLTCQSNRFIDNSTNSMVLSTANTKVLPFSPFTPTRSYSKDAVGGSAFFDGTGDSLTSDGENNELHQFGTGDFTAECWYYCTKDSVTDQLILSVRESTGGADEWALEYFSTANQLEIHSGTTPGVLTATNVYPHQWVHAAFTRESGTSRLFVNGVLRDTDTGSLTFNAGHRFGIGNEINFTGPSPFLGYITNVRITKGTAIYTSAFTPPTAPLSEVTNTTYLLNFANGGIIDHTMKNNLETEGNTRISTRVKQFGTGSVFLDGSDELNINDDKSETFSFGTGLFTVEAFIRVESGSGGSGQWFTNEGHGGWGTGGIAIYLQSAITVWFNDYNASSSFMSYDGNYDDGVMRHFVIVRGTSGACAIFVNGTRVATGTHTGNVGRTGGMGIGNYKGSSRHLTGYIDEMRVTKGVARYDPSQSSVTVPTKAFANK